MKNLEKESKQAVTFVNFSNKDFTGKWDGVDYPFKAGQHYMLPQYQAKHFAKHLVDREMTRKGVNTDHFSRPEYEKKCFGTETMTAPDEAKLKADILNKSEEKPKEEPKEKKRFCDSCDSKGVRHKKVCPKVKE